MESKKNLFEELQEKKQMLRTFAKNALDKGWITRESYKGITDKIENDSLTIGVIGQMKCGKSTFLNAFIFEDDVLPAATTPMTASLSVITYGEKKELEAEFYTKDEWEELKMQASRDTEELKNDPVELSKVKAAKELVDKSTVLGSSIDSLLGTKKKDDLGKLVEYVGADGKFVSITKSVRILYPKEWLKGVEIVDTPGFNDPVVSREERTKEFLQKADVVLLLLYAGRAFDATDRDIVFEHVRSVGVGKILIGVNKYDLCYAEGETEDEIISNVTDEIKKACREYRDSLVSELLKNETPILFSASMALMGKMPISNITNNADYKFQWDRICDIFEISTQKEMLRKSLIDDLENSVRSVIEKSKYEILFRKPANMILQAGINAKDEISKKLNDAKELVKSLELPNDELIAKIEQLVKAQRRVERKIERATQDLSDSLDDISKQCTRKMGEAKDIFAQNVRQRIDTEKKSSIARNVRAECDKFMNRSIPKIIDETKFNIGNAVADQVENLLDEIKDVLRRYVDDPEDLIETFSISMRKFVKEKGSSELNMDDLFLDDLYTWNDFKASIPNYDGFLWGICYSRNNVHSAFDYGLDSISFDKVKQTLAEKKQSIMDLMNTESAQQILQKLINELNAAMADEKKRQSQLEQARQSTDKLTTDLKNIDTQVKEMQNLKKQIA